MRGSKLQPTSNRDGNHHPYSKENSDNNTTEMDRQNGVLRLGRFRLRLPSHKHHHHHRKVPDDVQSTSSGSGSWTTLTEDQQQRHVPSIIIPTQQQQHEETDLHSPEDSPLSSSSSCRAMTVYQPPDSLSEALGDWLQASETLLRSDELHLFVAATCHVVCSVGDLAVRTALLPVTVPLHVACSTVGGTLHVVSSAGSLIGAVVSWSLTTTTRTRLGASTCTSDGQLVPPQECRQSSTKTKRLHDDDGTDHHHALADKMHYLERLRLDYTLDDSEAIETVGHGHYSKKTLSKKSEFLLRVADLGVTTFDAAKGQDVKVYYVDLGCEKTSDDYSLIPVALQRLFYTGMSLLSKHPTVRLTKHYPSDYTIDWKAESSTAKLLREMAKMSTLERLQLLQGSVLVWSGKFRDESNKNALPAFLARGIVQKSPRDFMMLLWDNARTAEYNNYCVARTDALVLQDKILDGASEGTKVVQSETRVPYTSLTVKAKCLMHVRPLEAPDAGFVILSRSLDAGDAGMHWNASDAVHKGSKNEILWGINIFRAVPNHPHLTDLTSLSQVSSSLVPTFMANRIGLMGVEDFFKNVRATNNKKC